MGRVVVDVLVSLDATGKVTAAKIVRSSGNAMMDQAAIKAAEESTYSPKLIALDARRQSTGLGSQAPAGPGRCVGVPGSYIYRVTFDPVG